MRIHVLFRLACALGLVAVLMLMQGAMAQQPADAAHAPATIYLMRHAEKLTDGREYLSVAGFMRAAALPQLFESAPGSARAALVKPDFLFATHPSKHSNRPFETLMPLSSALNLPISNEIENDNFADLAKLLLSGKYAGKVVLVSWHHGNLPKLATALGATPPYTSWPETQFDHIWRIDYQAGKAKLTDVPERLMPGDSH